MVQRTIAVSSFDAVLVEVQIRISCLEGVFPLLMQRFWRVFYDKVISFFGINYCKDDLADPCM